MKRDSERRSLEVGLCSGHLEAFHTTSRKGVGRRFEWPLVLRAKVASAMVWDKNHATAHKNPPNCSYAGKENEITGKKPAPWGTEKTCCTLRLYYVANFTSMLAATYPGGVSWTRPPGFVPVRDTLARKGWRPRQGGRPRLLVSGIGALYGDGVLARG